MHREILTQSQLKLLPIVKLFQDSFGLVGGTAIAFHIGHRESMDFDLFSEKIFVNSNIRRKIFSVEPLMEVIYEETGQLTMVIGEVKFTFYNYRYPIEYSENFENVARIPSLLTLGAMKVFALGNRAKWKDYVDLYFILKDHHALSEISQRAKDIFGKEYNERLMRMQLGWFEDINYSEPVIYKAGFEVPDQAVKEALLEYSLA